MHLCGPAACHCSAARRRKRPQKFAAASMRCFSAGHKSLQPQRVEQRCPSPPRADERRLPQNEMQGTPSVSLLRTPQTTPSRKNQLVKHTPENHVSIQTGPTQPECILFQSLYANETANFFGAEQGEQIRSLRQRVLVVFLCASSFGVRCILTFMPFRAVFFADLLLIGCSPTQHTVAGVSFEQTLFDLSVSFCKASLLPGLQRRCAHFTLRTSSEIYTKSGTSSPLSQPRR